MNSVGVEIRNDAAPGVMLVTMSRPERRNALDVTLLEGLRQAQRHAVRRGARALVLTGAPPAFSAGADLTGVDADGFHQLLAAVLEGFEELPCPVMAAVEGPAVGAGAQLLAVCDLRVATPDSLVAIPAGKLGLAVDQRTVARLDREFTRPVTRAMLLAAETYTGARLHALGVVHRLGGVAEALEWAADVAALAPLSCVAHKMALVGAPPRDPDVDRARERAKTSDDAQEGRRAFRDKRPPRFTGR